MTQPLYSLSRSAEDPATAIRQRCATLEKGAADLVEQVKRLSADIARMAEHRPPPARRAVSVNEAAESLGVSRTTMFGLLESGEVRSVKVGTRRLVPVVALDAFLAAS